YSSGSSFPELVCVSLFPGGRPPRAVAIVNHKQVSATSRRTGRLERIAQKALTFAQNLQGKIVTSPLLRSFSMARSPSSNGRNFPAISKAVRHNPPTPGGNAATVGCSINVHRRARSARAGSSIGSYHVRG